MKRLLFIAAMFLACSAQAEIKTDSVNNYRYVDIAPVVVLNNSAVRMSVPAYTDNNENQATAYVVLYDVRGERVTDFNVVIKGKDYTDWNGNDPESIYDIIARIKHFTIQN